MGVVRLRRMPARNNRYRPHAVAVFAALLLIALFGGGLVSSATASADEDYLIATDITFAPFEFQDKNGNFVGIDMDLIQEIAKDQNFTVDIKPLGFDAALQAVQANQVDGVIAGMSITDERKQVFDFSDPYFESGVQMAVLEDQQRHQVLRGSARQAGRGQDRHRRRDLRRVDQGQVRLQHRLLRRLGLDVRRGPHRQLARRLRRLPGAAVRHRPGQRASRP